MNRGVWASVRCGVAIATVMVGAAGCGQRGDRGLFKVAGPNTPATVAAFEPHQGPGGDVGVHVGGPSRHDGLRGLVQRLGGA